LEKQTIYSIVDEGTPITDVRATLTNITYSASGVAPTRIVSGVCNAPGVNACESRKGWFADLPGSGERIVVDMKLDGEGNKTINAASSILDSNPCNAGGTAQLYKINALTGLDPTISRDAPAGTTSRVSETSSLGLPVGTSTVRIKNPDGTTSSVAVGTLSTGKEFFGSPNPPGAPPTGSRVTWREIIQ
jgi:type IV pilus assembly protein PilY1